MNSACLDAVMMVTIVLGTARTSAGQVTILPDTTRYVYASGRGSITVSPDMATVQLGVFAIDPDARKAKATVDATIGRIIALATTLGLDSNVLKSTALNIEPRYDAENLSRFRGYEVTRSVTAIVRDLGKLDGLLDGAVQAGANRNFDVDISSSREPELKREALMLALSDAKARRNCRQSSSAFASAQCGAST